MEFAEAIKQTPASAQALLEGRTAVTLAVARELVRAFGSSVEFWMSRDFQYREDAGRLHAAEDEWLRQVPLGDMIKFGWIDPVRPPDELSAALDFFDVPNVPAWHEAHANLEKMAAFRTSAAFDSEPAAVAAWLRQGERLGHAITCAPWNPAGFRTALAEMRALTRTKNPDRFVPELTRLCAENGVALVIVRAPTGCRASGATRFLSRDKALLMLSFRHLTDDQFWFTFFHEAAHLLLHGDTELFLEGIDTPSTVQEDEANNLAARTLVPPEFYSDLSRLSSTSMDIIRFASRVGVSPGIIVGQLQHMGVLGFHQQNRLKRRFTWRD
jgi:Zn-dependent peptidase ImmA (M78 family)